MSLHQWYSVRILLLLFLFYFYFYFFSFFGERSWKSRRSKLTIGKALNQRVDEDIFIWWQEWFIPDCYAWFCWLCQFSGLAMFILYLPFLFQQINIGSEMDGRMFFFECESCYWSLNVTIDITLSGVYIFHIIDFDVWKI